MERILTSLWMLAMMLPMFGQKLNSRGEKMVSSICCYRDGKAYGNTNFEYNADGSLRSISNGTGKIECDRGKFAFSGWALQTQTPIYEITTDANNRIATIKRITRLLNNRGISFDLYGLKYGYCSVLGKDVLIADSSSTWYQEKEGQPYMDGSHEYNCTHYTYSNDGLQRIMFVQSDHLVKDFIYYNNTIIYGDAINDTNINLPILFWSNAVSDEISLLSLTEWCPMYNPQLAIEEKNNESVTTLYEYDYYDINIVGIRIYQKTSSGPKLRSIWKINYVEE